METEDDLKSVASLENMSNNSQKPEILVNKLPDASVANSINSYLQHLRETQKESPSLDIASGFFNIGGWALLAEELEQLSGVRLLLGAEPKEPEQQIRNLENTSNSKNTIQKALDEQKETIFFDRNLLGFDMESNKLATKLLSWLESKNVEVRQLKDKLLHGKSYIVSTNNDGVIVGSSNLTRAGLSKNIELNLGSYQPSIVSQVRDWFDELWEQADEFDLASYYSALYQEYDPYLIFLRMLWEYYGKEIEEANNGELFVSDIKLTEFQRDGLRRARQILEKRNGVLIADEVGLGKTYIAGEIIKDFVQEQRRRALLIVPAALRDGAWKNFIEKKHNIYCQTLSYEELGNDSRLESGSRPEQEAEKKHKLDSAPNEYSLVVIDEAHNLRNRKSKRARAVKELLKGSPAKKLVLLTATPVNNSLDDLENLLNYFLKDDATLIDKNITSISEKFNEAKKQDPSALSPDLLHTLLDAVAVRRTRQFIEDKYTDDFLEESDGTKIPINFPKPKLARVTYNLNQVLPPGFFEDFAEKLSKDPSNGDSPQTGDYLTLARYTPSKYRLQKDAEIQHRETNIAGLMRIGLLKRLESSTYAFAKTCESFLRGHYELLKFIENGKIPLKTTLRDWISTDSEDLEEYLEDFDKDDENLELEDASNYDVRQLKNDIENDIEILENFKSQVQTIQPENDPKLNALIQELIIIANESEAENEVVTKNNPSKRDRRKVIIFSFFADTVQWIHDFLKASIETNPELAKYKGRLAPIVSGATSNRGTAEIIKRFSPETVEFQKDAPQDEGDYDILVATDVLAEGLNLQQARHIINYDLPWNPMRLVQRQGRINRLLSKHPEIFLRCVYPAQELDELLKLEKRLKEKIHLAAGSIGASKILPGSRVEEVTFTEVLDDPDFLKRGGKIGGIDGAEEFRWELKTALAEDSGLKNRLKDLAWGVGSGFVATDENIPGFIFCAKSADYEEPHFRFVPWEMVEKKKSEPNTETGEAIEESPIIEHEHFVCLSLAKVRPETERVLDSSTQEMAYLAWELARADICEKWRQDNTQHQNAKLDRQVRGAVSLIETHGKTIFESDKVAYLRSVFNQYLQIDIISSIRKILKEEETNERQKIYKLEKLAEKEALTPTKYRPRSEIHPEDIYLIAWLAISPG